MADAYTRSYGDVTTSNFPKVGEHPLEGTIVNTSGNRSPYTHAEGRFTGGDAMGGGMAVRGVGSDATGEHSGPAFAPQSTVVYNNSPEASQTGRGMRAIRSVASRSGNGGFWDQRSSQTGQVIA